MPTVHVVIAYGNPKVAVMAEALAREVGGPGADCRVASDHTAVVVDFGTEEQAEEFRKDIKGLIPTLAYVSPA
jgi:hypothetical protein